jgi:hypothetical protein
LVSMLSVVMLNVVAPPAKGLRGYYNHTRILNIE